MKTWNDELKQTPKKIFCQLSPREMEVVFAKTPPPFGIISPEYGQKNMPI
jgi:hypothetical protein